MEKEEKCKWCEKPAFTKKVIPNRYYDVCQNEDCILKLDYLYKYDRNMIIFQFVTMIGIVPLLTVGLSVLFNLGSVLFFLKDENYGGLFYHIDIMSSSLILLLLLIIFYPINIIGDFFLSVKIKKKRNWKEIFGFVVITIASVILLDFSWELISNTTNQNVHDKNTVPNFFLLVALSEHFLLYLSIAVYIYFSKFFKKTHLGL
jgi:hypothetical protein